MKNSFVFNEKSVEKHFRSIISFTAEKAVYEVMSGTGLVPDLLGRGDRFIELQRIDGKTLGEIFRNCTEEEMFAAAKLAGQWFCDFQTEYHRRTGRWLILGDANPRNFIIYNNVLYGIDFEAARHGSLTKAAGDFLGWYVSENDLIYECYEIIADVIMRQLPRCDIHKAGIAARRTYYPRQDRRRLMKFIRQTDCCIIAGGKSSRMGRPKGLLPMAGHTICDVIIHNMEVFDRIFLSANLEEYSRYRLDMVGDSFRDIGPLAAIHSALTHSQKDWVMLCPCDMPFADKEVVFALFEEGFFTHNRRTNQREVKEKLPRAVIITDGEKPYPVLGLYHKSALPAVEKRIASGNYRLRHLLNNIDTVYVHFADKSKLRNINTEEEYRKMI